MLWRTGGLNATFTEQIHEGSNLSAIRFDSHGSGAGTIGSAGGHGGCGGRMRRWGRLGLWGLRMGSTCYHRCHYGGKKGKWPHFDRPGIRTLPLPGLWSPVPAANHRCPCHRRCRPVGCIAWQPWYEPFGDASILILPLACQGCQQTQKTQVEDDRSIR